MGIPDAQTQAGIPTSPTVDGVLPDNALGRAIAIAVLLSLVVSMIQIPTRSRTGLRSCLVIQSLVYWIVVAFGNVVTTILASAAVTKLPSGLAPYYFLFCAFFGVFAFEAVLKNTNVTMFDRGVLTIQDWIEKALNAAAAAALDNEETRKRAAENRLVALLMRRREMDINTLVLNTLGAGTVAALDDAARASSADPKMYKILQYVTRLSPAERSALLSGASNDSASVVGPDAIDPAMSAARPPVPPGPPVIQAGPARNDG
jgi:hypothetical protein